MYIHFKTKFSAVRRRPESSAGATVFFWSAGAGAGVGVLSPSCGWKVRMTRNVAILKKLWLQIIATLNLLNVHNYLKSYLLCQTISATANGQIAISHYMSVTYLMSQEKLLCR